MPLQRPFFQLHQTQRSPGHPPPTAQQRNLMRVCRAALSLGLVGLLPAHLNPLTPPLVRHPLRPRWLLQQSLWRRQHAPRRPMGQS